MIKLPAKAQDRLTKGVKCFQPIVAQAKDKDINESDTVTIVTDILCNVFGYDKYSEITSEYAIKKTFCDLAVKIKDKVALLIEVKAAGLTLKDDYIKQAVDYGANAGIDWVILTNAVTWKIFKITFSKPVAKELIYEFDFCDLNTKKQADLEMLYCISKESVSKTSNNLLYEIAAQKQIMNHFIIGQLCLTDTVLDAIRRQIKKMSPEIKVQNDEIKEIMLSNVIKRDVFDGEKSDDAKRKISKFLRAQQKQKTTTKETKITNGEK